MSLYGCLALFISLRCFPYICVSSTVRSHSIGYGYLSGLLQDDELQKAMHDKLGFGNPHGHSTVVLEDIGLDQVPTKDVYPRIAIVAFSSNSSLCGTFNANVIKKYHETIRILEGQGYGKEDIDIYAIGRKMAMSR